mgnify:CR=1 FL=1
MDSDRQIDSGIVMVLPKNVVRLSKVVIALIELGYAAPYINLAMVSCPATGERTTAVCTDALITMALNNNGVKTQCRAGLSHPVHGRDVSPGSFL